MPIALDHLLIPARDRRAAAERLAAILGVPWSAQAAVGPFSAVYVSNALTVDFDQVAAEVAGHRLAQHAHGAGRFPGQHRGGRAHRLLARAGWACLGGADAELSTPPAGRLSGCGLCPPPGCLPHRR